MAQEVIAVEFIAKLLPLFPILPDYLKVGQKIFCSKSLPGRKVSVSLGEAVFLSPFESDNSTMEESPKVFF